MTTKRPILGVTSCWVALFLSLNSLTIESLVAAEIPTRTVPNATHLSQNTMFGSRLIDGQIRVSSQNFGGSTTSSSDSGGRKETSSIVFNNGGCQIDYSLTTETETVHLEFNSNGDRAAATVTPKANGPQITFLQEKGACTLAAKIGDQAWDLRGDSLWHLFLAEPELCRKQLAPLLETLRPKWKMSDMAADLESNLFKLAKGYVPEDVDKLRPLIADLGLPTYAQRRAADRKLRDAGRTALPFLQSLDLTKMDAEQRSRIEAILTLYLNHSTDDSPEQMAAQLLGDRRIWLALLNRNELEKREQASLHLSRLLNHPLDFEPAADAKTRAEQLARMQASFNGPAKKE